MSTGRLKAVLSKTPLVMLPLILVLFYFATHETGSSVVLRDAERIYIVDRTGERWDVTQAVSLGFDPDGFEFGLGKEAFIPLDDSLLTEDTSDVSNSMRVIGLTDGSSAQAYTIGRLWGHEVSNSNIGSDPVAVSY
jgi:hypothetical protein